MFSALIDFVLIYCVTYLLQLLLMRWIYFDTFVVFTVCWVLYYSISYLVFRGRSTAKLITGLQVVSRDNESLNIRQVAIREVAGKFLILLLIPSYIIHHIHFYLKSQIWNTGAVVLLAILVMMVFFFIYKRPWWEQLSSTKTVRNRVGNQLLRFVTFTAISGIFILTIYIKVAPIGRDFRLAGVKYFPEYPVNAETKKYAGYIKTHSEDPVEYVFRLFKKYDLVVLDERLHPEYSQYELIFRIVTDPRFACNIGNIYTESGSQSYQDTLTRYLNTRFPNQDTMNKATAWFENNSSALWPIWGTTNLFDFLKLVNKLNTNSPDSLKINWYCTDIPMNWALMTPAKFQQIPRKEKRDKIMADRITAIYKDKIRNNEKRRKGLVIMNHWHGYGLIRDHRGNKTGHFLNTFCTTAILMDSLPGKVCNILINRIPFGLFSSFMGPVQHGKWDKAFEISGNHDAGFDFDNSPLGSDNFDDFLWNSSSELKYKDVFTGFIFYKPLEHHYQRDGYPFILYNFQDTLIRRAGCISPSYLEGIKSLIRNKEFDKIDSRGIFYAFYYNCTVNLGYSLVIALTWIITLLFYATTRKR